MKRSIRYSLPLVILAMTACLASPTLAKSVVCIDGLGDRYCNNGEGYYRQLLAADPTAVICVGNALTSCLQQVVNNDNLVIVCHGEPGCFHYWDLCWSGFRGGLGAAGTRLPGLPAFPLPANFNAPGLSLTVDLVMCRGGADPDGAGGPQIPVTTSLGNALAAPWTVMGCEGDSYTFRNTYTLAGGTDVQQAAAQACLVAAAVAADPANPADTKGVRRWLAGFRPANVPAGVVPNAQTIANTAIALANCPAAGGAVTIAFDYSCAPVDPLLAQARDCDLADADGECNCEGGLVGFACCLADGHCEVLLPDDCESFGGEVYHMQSCDPNPCPPVPTDPESWGSIKAVYR